MLVSVALVTMLVSEGIVEYSQLLREGLLNIHNCCDAFARGIPQDFDFFQVVVPSQQCGSDVRVVVYRKYKPWVLRLFTIGGYFWGSTFHVPKVRRTFGETCSL